MWQCNSCYFSSMSCDTGKWPWCSPVVSARGGCVRLHAHVGIWLPQVPPVFPCSLLPSSASLLCDAIMGFPCINGFLSWEHVEFWSVVYFCIVLQIWAVKYQVFHIILPEGQPDSCNYLKKDIFLLKQLYNFKCLELLTSKEPVFKDQSSLGLNLDVYLTLQFTWKEVKSLNYLC